MSDRGASRPPLSLSRRLLFSAVTTALVLCVVELCVRAAGYGRLVVVARDPDVGWRNVPNQDRVTEHGGFRVHIDSHGFRDEEFPREKPEGEFRVLVLGDSLTYGLDADQDRIWPRLLDRSLASRAGATRRVRVMNAAVQGYDAAQERDLLMKRGFDFGPDVVLVAFYQNDIDFSERKAAPRDFPGRDLLRRTAIFEAVEWNWLRVVEEARGRRGESALGTQNDERYRRYLGVLAYDVNADDVKRRIVLARELLLEMNAECRRRGVAFAVALLPGFAETADPTTNHLSIDVAWNLEHAHVPHVDLIQALQPVHERAWLEDRGHLTDLGHATVAAAIERFLVEGHLVP